MFRFGNHYYEGSSFWESFIITFIGAIIGGFFSGLIFYLTIKNNRKEEDNKTKSSHQNKIRFLVNLLTKVIEENGKQIANYKSQVKDIKVNPFEYHLVKLLASNQIRRLQNIDSQSLFEAFMSLVSGTAIEKVEKYNKLLVRIDFVEKGTSQMFSLNEANIKFVGEQQRLMKDKVDQLYTEFLSYNDVLSKLDFDYWRAFQEYVGTGRLDIKVFHNDFLIVLFGKLKDLTPQIDEANIKLKANKLLGEIRSITVPIDYYKQNNLYYAEEVRELYEQIEVVMQDIDGNIRELKTSI